MLTAQGLKTVIDDEIDAMQGTPEYERPASTVPKAAEHHGQQQVDVTLQCSIPVATERNIEIVTQESGQGHVPTSPEIGDIQRLVGRIEIVGQADIEHPCQPN